MRANRIIPIVLALATAVVFGRALQDGFVYDDHVLIETNAALRDPGPLLHYLATPLFAGTASQDGQAWAAGGTTYWRPFVKLLLLLQFRAHGLAATGWHLWSLLVHITTVVLLWVWLCQRLGASSAGSSFVTFAAAGAALIFAVHPSRVEAVAWISGTADLWLTFWILVGLVAWSRRSWGATIVATLAFVLAALCKETAFIVPICLAVEAALLRDERRRAFARVGVVTGALAILFIVRWLSVGAIGIGTLREMSLLRPLACLGLYIGSVVWPWQPSTQMGLVSTDGRFVLQSWSIVLGAVGLFGCFGLAWLVRRGRVPRGVLADTSWFLLALLPVLQIVPLGYSTLAALRFLSMPFIGAASLGARALSAGFARPRLRMLLAIGTTGVIVACALITMSFVPAFRSNSTLWAWELRLQPQHPLLHLYAARAAWSEQRLPDALDSAQRSYEYARHPDTRAEAALAWAEITLQKTRDRDMPLLESLCRFFECFASSDEACRLQAPNVSFAVEPRAEYRSRAVQAASFCSARAVANARTGRFEAAASGFRTLLARDTSAATYENLVRALACDAQWDEAHHMLRDGRAKWPQNNWLRNQEMILDRLQSPDGADPIGRATTRAQLWLALGSTYRARVELEPLRTAHVTDARLDAAQAQIEAASGDSRSVPSVDSLFR